MKTVADRIEQAPACAIINLDEEERGIYTGAGWKLARFVDGRLRGFFDPMNIPSEPDVQRMADAAVEAAITWLANAEGEVWLAMCSCGQLCEPRRVTFTDAAALARMARVFAEQFIDLDPGD